jgi:phage FluMu protein Com
MARVVMRQIREGEVPKDGGTAVQDDPDRPVFRGNGPNDYVCVQCGNLLATGMDPLYMTPKVRVKCAVCKTINVAIPDESIDPEAARAANRIKPR